MIKSQSGDGGRLCVRAGMREGGKPGRKSHTWYGG